MSGYVYAQPSWGQSFVNMVTWIWNKTFGLLIQLFRNWMCPPTWTATILWIIFFAVLGTAIWGVIKYATGIKPLTPTCPACPKSNANNLMSTPVMITPV